MGLKLPPKSCLRVLAAACCVLAPACASASDLDQFELDCVIEPHVVVDVTSSAEGVLSDVHVDRSQSIERGQVIAELDSSAEAATVDVARARATTNTQIRLNQASLGLDERNMARTEALYRKNAVALTLHDEARTTAEVSTLRLRKAREDKHLAELELVRAEVALEQRKVLSPVSGVVVERYKSPGEYVENEAIVRVAQLHPLRVEVVAPVQLFGAIKPGMQAEITPELDSETVRRARVTVVDQVMDAASGTFGVRLELPNPNYDLPGGLRCQVQFLPDELMSSPEESLARESTEQPNTGDEVQPEFHASVADATRDHVPICRSLGPIASAEQAELLARALAAPGVGIAQREETRSSVVGYVLIAATPPGQSADAFERLLVAQGISDYHHYRRGDFMGSFSLGYYRKKQSALDRLAQLTSLDIVADIKPQTESNPEYWLNLTASDEYLDELALLRTAQATLPDSTPQLGICSKMMAADMPLDNAAVAVP